MNVFTKRERLKFGANQQGKRNEFVVERGDGVVHAGDAEGEVVHHAGLVKSWVGAGVEHVFEPVGAVWNLEADPVVDAIVFGAAVPVRPEAQDLLPERILFLAVGHNEAYVDDAGAGC